MRLALWDDRVVHFDAEAVRAIQHKEPIITTLWEHYLRQLMLDRWKQQRGNNTFPGPL